jgi:hypothetical protein
VGQTGAAEWRQFSRCKLRKIAPAREAAGGVTRADAGKAAAKCH